MANRLLKYNSQSDYEAAKGALLIPYVATYPSTTDGKTVVVYANADGTNTSEVIATAQLTDIINSLSEELDGFESETNTKFFRAIGGGISKFDLVLNKAITGSGEYIDVNGWILLDKIPIGKADNVYLRISDNDMSYYMHVICVFGDNDGSNFLGQISLTGANRVKFKTNDVFETYPNATYIAVVFWNGSASTELSPSDVSDVVVSLSADSMPWLSVGHADKASLSEIAELSKDTYNAKVASIASSVEHKNILPFNWQVVPYGVKDGHALLSKIKGNSINYNQFCRNGRFTQGTDGTYAWQAASGASISVVNGNLRCSYTSTYVNVSNQGGNGISGHIYYCKFKYKCENLNRAYAFNVGNKGDIIKSSISDWELCKRIVRPTDSTHSIFTIYSREDTNSYIDINGAYGIQVYDLTQMFGTEANILNILGIESWDDETIIVAMDKVLNLPYYEWIYPGKLLNTTFTGIKSVGYNAWDETWELGSISNNGFNEADSSNIRSKNYIKVLPNTRYFFKCWTGLRVVFYDIYHNIITPNNPDKGVIMKPWNSWVVTPVNCSYIRFATMGYGNTYKYDICISIDIFGTATLNHSDKNSGKYQRYWEDTLKVSITQLKDISGNYIFPNGMMGFGGEYDETDGKYAIKRFGYRAYESGDDSDESVITDGTNTVYKLSVPEIVELSDNSKFVPTIRVDKCGTIETISNPENEIPDCSQLVCDIMYPLEDVVKYSPIKLFPETSLPVISFEFDDNEINDEQFVELFEQYGLTCGFAFIASKANIFEHAERYLSYQKRGFQILNHSVDGKIFNTTNYDSTTALEAIFTAKARIEKAGMRCNGFVAPSSQFDGTFLPILKKAHSYAFGSWANGTNNGREQDRCDLHRYAMTHAIADVKSFIDTCITNDQIITLYAHGFELGTTIDGEVFTIDKVKEIIEYCIAKRDAGLLYIAGSDECVKCFFNL